MKFVITKLTNELKSWERILYETIRISETSSYEDCNFEREIMEATWKIAELKEAIKVLNGYTKTRATETPNKSVVCKHPNSIYNICFESHYCPDCKQVL